MLKDLAKEYCNESSIHGLRYLIDKRKTPVERALWILFVMISIAACFWFTVNLYISAQQSSIVVTISNRPMLITDITFPSMTICPTNPFNASKINVRKIFETGQYDNSSDISQMEWLALCAQYCSILDLEMDKSFDYIEALLKANLRINYLRKCFLGIGRQTCVKDFQEIITNLGICYAYNSLSYKELLRSHNGTTYDFSKKLLQLPNSFSKIKKILGTHERGRIHIQFKIEAETIEKYCQPKLHSFLVAFRLPRDVVVLNSADWQIKEDYATDLSLTPSVVSSSENLKSFRVEERECYYEDERELFFMRYYTQENCHFECLTNRTLNRCGCVNYYMPRLRSTRVCIGTKLMRCAKEVEQAYDNIGIGPCRCYNLCNFVEFQVNIASSKLNVNQNDGEKLTETRIAVFTKDKSVNPLYRSELYGFNDYVANIGGLLGLFLGVSILSIIELLYYMTIRPLCVWLRVLMQTKKVFHEIELNVVKPFTKTRRTRPKIPSALRHFKDETIAVKWASVVKQKE